MSSPNVELASTTLSVGLSTQGLGKNILAAVKGVGGQVAGLGRKAGGDFKSGFESQSAGATRAAVSDQAKLQRAVADTAKRIKAARDAESDATRKVAIEERKLEELRAGGKAKASQLLAAEDRLVKARRAGALATDKVSAEVKQYTKAQNDLQNELDQTKRKTDEAARSTQGFGAKVKSGFSKIGNPFGGLKRQAERAGSQSGTGFASKMSGGVKAGVGKMGGMLKAGIVGIAAGAGVAGAAELWGKITDASNLEQSKGGVEAIFKGQAEGILAASKQAATGLGLTENSYNELATRLGAGLKNKGIKEFAGQTEDLIGLGADLSAMFGGTTTEAVEAISSLMRGESDPIEKYGVAINETAIKAELAAKGQDKLTGSALEQAKAQARLNILFRQTKDAQGAFNRESDTMAGKQARAAAQWENFTTKVAGLFLPAITSGFGWLSETAIPAVEGFFNVLQGGGGGEGRPQWLKDIGGWASQFTPQVEGIKSAFTGLWATAEPIFKQIYDAVMVKWTELQPTVTAIWEGIQRTIADVMTVVQKVVEGVTGFISMVWGVVGEQVVGIVTGFMGAVVGVFSGIGQVIGGIWSALAGILTGDWQKALDGLVGIATGFGTVIGSVVGGIANFVVNLFTGIWKWVKIPFIAGWNWVKGVFTGAWNWVKTTFATLWSGFTRILTAPIDAAKTAIDTALRNISQGFENTKKGIGTAWAGLKSAMSAPVRWVADNVVNPLLGAVRSLLRNVGLNSLADKLPDWKFEGFAEGGWTGPGGKYQVAGVVHADEFVVNKRARRAFERRHPGALDHLNMYGRLPGYDTGGQVRPLPGRWTTYPGHRGIDFPTGSSQPPVRAWRAGRVSLIYPYHYSWGKYVKVDHGGGLQTAYAHLSRFATQVGAILAAGQVLGYVGSTGNSTGNHLHWEVWRNGTRVFPAPYLSGTKVMPGGHGKAVDDPSGGNFAADLVKGAVQAFMGKNAPTGGVFGQAVSAIPAMLVDGITKAVTNGYASGTSYAAPGYAWVGERGPEIVRFRGGERVFTAADSAAMAGGAGQVYYLVVEDGVALRAYVDNRVRGWDRGQGARLTMAGVPS